MSLAFLDDRRRYHDAVKRCKRRITFEALRLHQGRVPAAAQWLGLTEAGVYLLIRQHVLQPELEALRARARSA